MPRPKRSTPSGCCYHFLSRGNGRQTVFPKDEDYAALRRSAFGSERWQRRTITALGLESTLGPAADPGKPNNEA